MHKHFKRFMIIVGICMVGIFNAVILQAQIMPIFRIGVLDSDDGALTRGAQLAVQQINQVGGVRGADGTMYRLQLVIQAPDDMDFALSNLEQASVIAVIGPEDSETALAHREALTALGVPVLTTATDDALLINDETNLMMRLNAQEALVQRALADYLINDLNAASLATVQLDLESTVGVIGFIRAASQLGLTPSEEYILSEENTIQRIALDIADEQTQFVAAYGVPEDVAELYTLLRENDWAGRFIYNRSSESRFRSNVQETLLQGIIGSSNWSYTLSDTASSRFIDAFIRTFGVLPAPKAAAAYDGIYLLQEAIQERGDLSGNLLAIDGFEGVQGMLGVASLADGEFSNQVVVSELGEFGAPLAIARYAGTQRLALADVAAASVTVVAVATVAPTLPPPTATPDGVYLVITRARQNVRTGPGLNYDIMGQLSEGDSAEVIGATVDFSWVAISYRGTNGWLSRSILDLNGNTNIVPILAAPPTPTPLPATATPIPPPQPDIIITNVTPSRLVIGTPVSITVTVRNQGGANAGQFAVATSFQPGEVYAAQIVSGLNAGAEITLTLTGTLNGATGPNNISIIADLNNQVNEGVGENNNASYIYSYVADDPLLSSASAIGTVTLNELDVVALDGGSNDIQWGGGAIVPLGATKLIQLTGFTSFDAVHRDAIANAPLTNVGVLNITPGMLVGIQTEGGNKYGVLQVISVAPGSQITFNYRMYDN